MNGFEFVMGNARNDRRGNFFGRAIDPGDQFLHEFRNFFSHRWLIDDFATMLSNHVLSVSIRRWPRSPTLEKLGMQFANTLFSDSLAAFNPFFHLLKRAVV